MAVLGLHAVCLTAPSFMRPQYFLNETAQVYIGFIASCNQKPDVHIDVRVNDVFIYSPIQKLSGTHKAWCLAFLAVHMQNSRAQPAYSQPNFTNCKVYASRTVCVLVSGLRGYTCDYRGP